MEHEAQVETKGVRLEIVSSAIHTKSFTHKGISVKEVISSLSDRKRLISWSREPLGAENPDKSGLLNPIVHCSYNELDPKGEDQAREKVQARFELLYPTELAKYSDLQAAARRGAKGLEVPEK